MKIAVLSDIHGNLSALDAALERRKITLSKRLSCWEIL